MSGSKIIKSGQNGLFVYAKGVATVNKCEILGSGNVGVIICEGSSAEVLSLSLSVSLSLCLSLCLSLSVSYTHDVLFNYRGSVGSAYSSRVTCARELIQGGVQGLGLRV
jgi:hypothetical protein